MIVAITLMVGFKPNLARDKIMIGSVVEPGPERNAVDTTSSREIVKVNSQDEASDCTIIGSVTSVNT